MTTHPAAHARSDRIELRDFSLDDLEAVQRFAGDSQVTRYLSWGPHDLDQTRAFLHRAIKHAEQVPRTHFEFAIILIESGELVGSCGLIKPGSPEEYAIGICLARAYWGQGIGGAAIDLLLRYGFNKLKAARIYAEVEPDNAVSVRLFTKLGFDFWGQLGSETLFGYLDRPYGYLESAE